MSIQDFFESLFKRSSPEVQKKQLLKKLENEKSIIVLEGLKQVKGRNLKKFLPLVKKIMVSFPMQAIRSFALMLLVDEKYNEEVEFLNVKEMIKVIPFSLAQSEQMKVLQLLQ